LRPFFFFAPFTAFAFLRFAIAALLAMNHGGCRISAFANRHALHSIYYSTTKKAAFHLTKCV
jgi:hypothetical protein